jgi:carboxyl-terminal processing protease
MRKLALALLAALLTPGAVTAEESQTIGEIVALVAQHSLYENPFAAGPPASMDELAERMRAVDPYFRYLEPDRDDDGETGVAPAHGIGGALVVDDDALLFVPYQDGAAFAAGVTEPGYLQAVADQPIEGMSLDEVAALVAASPDQQDLRIAIAAVRGNEPASAHVIALSSYNPPDLEVQDESPPVIRIYDFAAGETAKALRAALLALEPEPGPIVLDLRFSQGGSLFEALDSASLFLPPDLLLARTRNRSGEHDQFTSLDAGPATTKAVVILIGPNTISAAEVFVRALTHHGRASTVGRPSYGKCVSQKVFRLADGAKIRLTNLLILDPAGGDCRGRGVEPDLLVVPELLYDTATVLHAASVAAAGSDSFSVCEAALADAARDADTRIRVLGLLFTLPDSPFAAGARRRVCIGPFASRADAEAWQERLTEGTKENYEAVEAAALLR